jgi:superfamily II DNA helicase RecQ
MSSTTHISPFTLLVAGPFGLYCSSCEQPVSGNYIRRHLLSKHGLKITEAEIRVLEKTSESAALGSTIPHLFGKPYTQHQCGICKATFSLKSNAARHVKKSKCVAIESDMTTTRVHSTTCGRVVRASEVVLREQRSGFEYIPPPPTVEGEVRCLSMMEATEKIKKFIPVNENPTYYVSLFLPLLHGPRTFEESIADIIGYSEDVLDNPLHKNLLVIAKNWLENYLGLHISMVPGDLRHAVLTFDSTTYGDVEQHAVFNARMSNEPLWIELGALLIFLCRHPLSKSRLKQLLLELLDFDPNNLVKYINTSLVPRILLEFALEKPPDLLQHPLLFIFCASRCFKKTKDGDLRMCQAAQNGTKFAAILHLTRAAVVSYLALFHSHTYDVDAKDIAVRARSSRLSNLLGPAIRKMRELHQAKPVISNHTISYNGDIKVDSLTFKSSLWSSLIPRLNGMAYVILEGFFGDTLWQQFIESPQIMVRMEKKVKITCESGLETNDLVFEDVNELMLDKLTSMVELSFHGLGCGSLRKEELSRILDHQVSFRNGGFYYYSHTCKTPHVYTAKGKLIEHKLPGIMGRVSLLYRVILQHHIPEFKQNFIWFRPNRKYWMVDLVKEIFDLSTTPTALQVRHLWTGITNAVFPSGEGTHLVATEEVANMSGHSSKTHDMFYGSNIEGGARELLYTKFHVAMGDVDTENTSKSMQLYRLSEGHLKTSLQTVLGTNVQFKSVEQRDMVLSSANSSFRHCAVSTGCGSGKSMSWLVPTYCRLLNGLPTGVSFVVLPYKFLVEYLFISAKSLFGCKSDAIVKMENNIMQELPPPLLTGDHSSMPSLIFLSIDAMSLLVKYHFGLLENLAKQSFIRKIFIDEVHSILGETLFRPVYDCLPKLTQLCVPIMTLSGTIPIKLSGCLHRYLGLSQDNQMTDIDQVTGGDPIGNGFVFHCKQVVFPPVSSVNLITRLLEQTSYSIHVICATRDWAHKVHTAVEKKGINSRLVTSEIDSDKQYIIAKEWRLSQFDVLVSTTAALVGNENQKCRTIIMVGLLYDACQIAQAIGRLRQNQRNNGAAVYILFDQPKPEVIKLWEDEHSKCYDSLNSRGILTADCRADYDKAFSRTSVLDLVRPNETCLVVRLRLLLGAIEGERCLNCPSCNSVNPIAKQAGLAKGLVRMDTKNTGKGMDFLHNLQERCSICLCSQCNGEKCMIPAGLQCFKCGGPHTVKSCDVSLHAILKNKACFYCYDLYERSGIHDKSLCPLKRRLKVVIMRYYWNSSSTVTFSAFIRRIFTTSQNFYNMMVTLNTTSTMIHTGPTFQAPTEQRDIGHSLTNGVPKRMGEILQNRRLAVTQIGCDDLLSPLLPPSYCQQSPDLGQDPNHVVGNRQHRISHVTYTNKSEAHSMYNFLRNEKKSCNTKRLYVYGFLYKTLFSGYHEIDPRVCKCVLEVNVSGQSLPTKVFITHTMESLLLDSVVCLGRALPKKGNGRVDRGDVGDIFGLGIRDAQRKIIYKPTEGLHKEITKVSSLFGPWLEKKLPGVSTNIADAEKKKQQKLCAPMIHGPGSSIMMSRNLGNASHLDVNDKSYSVTIWAEEKKDLAENWFYVMPNVKYNGSLGVVVRLSHGTVIAWDGRLIRHCTTVTNVGTDNNVFGCMFGSCR